MTRPAPELPAQDTGVLIHGRHLGAVDYNRMLWGTPDFERHLGVLPTAVLAMLNAGPERIHTISIGSGGSVRNEIQLEAYVAYNTLRARFHEFELFKPIREHPAWVDGVFHIVMAVDDAVLDTKARNTEEEIANAAKLFEERGLTRVIEVTNRDHGARCLDDQNRAREHGAIPVNQQWSIVTDDEPYWEGLFVPPVVVEPPHREDDPVLQWDPALWPASLVKRFLALPPGIRYRTSTLIHELLLASEELEPPTPEN